MMYLCWIIMLYTLNLYSAVCQLYPNKIGRKKKKEWREDERKGDCPLLPWVQFIKCWNWSILLPDKVHFASSHSHYPHSYASGKEEGFFVVVGHIVYYFANKGLYSQSYGFSSSHVLMWESDHKEGWAWKNGCCWTMVLEKTLESPWDYKEFKVNPKGNQSWIFIRRTDTEAKTPIFWPPVWMWELDYKESWIPNNWCFWTVVLKNIESPLDFEEIQPFHSKEDQSWVFVGRTDVEAETPILWPHDAKSWLTGKDPDAGKDWGQEEKGMTEDGMVGWHQWLNGHEFG